MTSLRVAEAANLAEHPAERLAVSTTINGAGHDGASTAGRAVRVLLATRQSVDILKYATP